MGARDAYLARGLPLHFQVEEAVRQGVTKARPSGSGHGSSSSTDITESADRTDELRCNFRRPGGDFRGLEKFLLYPQDHVNGVAEHSRSAYVAWLPFSWRHLTSWYQPRQMSNIKQIQI
jgi:hypothetical protein